MQLSLGYGRFLLTGIFFAIWFAAMLRFAGRLTAPFHAWKCFRGKCIDAQQQNGRTAATVQFSDTNRMTHTAAFLTDEALKPDQSVRIAIRAAVFFAGLYPQTLAEADSAGEDILTSGAFIRLMRRILCKELLIGLLTSGAAFAALAVVMWQCF